MRYVTADVAEQSLDYAVADQLLRVAGDARPDLVGRTDGPPDIAAVGLRLLESWAERERERPALVDRRCALGHAASLRALSVRAAAGRRGAGRRRARRA